MPLRRKHNSAIPPICLALLVSLLYGLSAPEPARVKVFGDWAVACDNILTCNAVSLSPEIRRSQQQWTVQVSRRAGPSDDFVSLMIMQAPIEIVLTRGVIHQSGGVMGFPRYLNVDGKRIVDYDQTVIDDRREPELRQVRALAGGRELNLRDESDRLLRTLSLDGLADALRYMDERQGRAETVTALAAIGSKKVETVPPAPQERVRQSMPPSGRAAVPDKSLVSNMRSQARCEAPSGSEGMSVHALGSGHTLALLKCLVPSGETSSTAFIVVGRDARPAKFETPPLRMFIGGTPRLANVDFLGNGALREVIKFSAAGDCGIERSYTWDGARFRLSWQSEMPVCRGSSQWLTTWRTAL